MAAGALSPALRERLSAALGCALGEVRRMSGGDINDAYALALADGRAVFLKTRDDADARMFPREARGLGWLAEAQALPVPEVLAASGEADGGDDSGAGPGFLVLELVRSGPRVADFDELLGRGLAAVHRCSPGEFGLAYDNFIGNLEQSNRPRPRWSEFYAEERLLPQVRRAIDAGRAPRSWVHSFDRLIAKLPEIVGPEEPPARLHGDLWAGNLLADAAGRPMLIDPAVYGGHREVDLAMLSLFGGVSGRVYDAYHEVYPLDRGWSSRVPLYHVYPLLVHLNLFGMSYGGQVERAIARYL